MPYVSVHRCPINLYYTDLLRIYTRVPGAVRGTALLAICTWPYGRLPKVLLTYVFPVGPVGVVGVDGKGVAEEHKEAQADPADGHQHEEDPEQYAVHLEARQLAHGHVGRICER